MGRTAVDRTQPNKDAMRGQPGQRQSWGAGEQNETWTRQAARLSPRRKRRLSSEWCAGVFPGGPVVRDPACQCRRRGIEPRSGRTPRAEGHWALEPQVTHHAQRQVPAGQAGFRTVRPRPSTARWGSPLEPTKLLLKNIRPPCSLLTAVSAEDILMDFRDVR